MTVQDIIDDARPKLGDTVYPFQWLDSYYFTPINDGIRELESRRPECLYVTAVVTTLPPDVTAVGDDVLITDEFRNDLVLLVVAQLAQEDKVNTARQEQVAAQAEGDPTP